MRSLVVAAILFASPASAWDRATATWCGTTVAAGSDGGVVLSDGATRTIPLGFSPQVLAWSNDCSKLAAAGDHVAVVDALTGVVTDFGATTQKVRPTPISWLGPRFTVAFYGPQATRGADALFVYDSASRSRVRLALPAGELDDVALRAADTAVVSFRSGTFGPLSLFVVTTAGARALSTPAFTRIFFAGSHAAAETTSRDAVAIDTTTGVQRAVASAVHVHGISRDGLSILTSASVMSSLVVRHPFAGGPTKTFALDTYAPEWSDGGGAIVGRRGASPGAHLVVHFDDGRAGGPNVAYDAGPSSDKLISKTAMSPNGARVAFVVTTKLPHHKISRCGDMSWEEKHELVVVQLGTPSTVLATKQLAQTLSCAYE